jgi:foldase protein PrsA
MAPSHTVSMLKTRLAPLAALAAILALVVAGCGSNDVPADVVVPDPPTFAKCAAAKAKQKVPKGVPKPKAADLKNQCKQEYEGLRDQTMQFLISAQWLQQEADKRDIKVTDAEVQKTFNQQKKQSFPKEADYQKFLKSSGQTEADLLFRVKLSVLTNKIQEDVVKGKGTVTDQQITAYYNKNKQRFAQPETRDLLVVLNPKKAKAQAALKAVKSGQSWKSVAKKYSTDDASKSQGGKLPSVTKGQQEKAFDTAIFKAPKGKVQGPVKTQFGYYVFKVTAVKPARQQPLAQVKETIRNLL